MGLSDRCGPAIWGAVFAFLVCGQVQVQAQGTGWLQGHQGSDRRKGSDCVVAV